MFIENRCALSPISYERATFIECISPLIVPIQFLGVYAVTIVSSAIVLWNTDVRDVIGKAYTGALYVESLAYTWISYVKDTIKDCKTLWYHNTSMERAISVIESEEKRHNTAVDYVAASESVVYDPYKEVHRHPLYWRILCNFPPEMLSKPEPQVFTLADDVRKLSEEEAKEAEWSEEAFFILANSSFYYRSTVRDIVDEEEWNKGKVAALTIFFKYKLEACKSLYWCQAREWVAAEANELDILLSRNISDVQSINIIESYAYKEDAISPLKLLLDYKSTSEAAVCLSGDAPWVEGIYSCFTPSSETCVPWPMHRVYAVLGMCPIAEASQIDAPTLTGDVVIAE